MLQKIVGPTISACLDSLWWIPATVLVAVACFACTCTPVLLDARPIDLPIAYREKARDPFADTARLPLRDPTNFAEFGPWSHGAKLTPRIVPSILLAAATRAGLHPYMPATIGGLLLLGSLIVATARVTGDKIVGSSVGLAAAGLYASATSFAVPFEPKPFDGVALGAVGLTVLAAARGWPLAVAATLCVACFCDERAAVSAIGIACLVAFTDTPLADRRRCLAALAVGIAAYAVVRAGLGAWLGWSRSDTSLLALGVVRTTLPLAGKAVWVAFEAMVVPIALLAWVLGRRRQWGLLALWSTGIAVSLASCLAVLDTSRAAAFLVFFLPAACAGLTRAGLDPRVVRLTVAASALGCLLLPTLDVIAGVHTIPVRSWLQRDPRRDAVALINRGDRLCEEGKLVEAEETLEQAMHLDPFNTKALERLGIVYAAGGRHEQALESFLKASRLAPNDPEPHYNRGILLAKVGRIDEAIAAFDDALSRDNTFRQAYFNRGVLQLRRGAERSARDDFRRCVDLGGNLPAQLQPLLADPTPP